MLDEDLAEIYGMTTKRLNEKVRRNKERFPLDFMFSLMVEEFDILRSSVSSSCIYRTRNLNAGYFLKHI